MEPEAPKNLTSMVAMIWIAVVTAIVVTIIDWKIKSDMLRIADAFYRVYPATLEKEHGKESSEPTPKQAAPGSAYSNHVLRVPVVGNDTGMETENATTSPRQVSEDNSNRWADFLPEGIETGLESRTIEDS